MGKVALIGRGERRSRDNAMMLMMIAYASGWRPPQKHFPLERFEEEKTIDPQAEEKMQRRLDKAQEKRERKANKRLTQGGKHDSR